MNALAKTRSGFLSLFARKKRVEVKKPLFARPCGEVDYDLLAEEVIQKYPKILGRLAE